MLIGQYNWANCGEWLSFGRKKTAFKAVFLKVADRTGLEPATSGVTGRHSNQLNYRSVECLNKQILVGGTRLELVTHAL